MYPTEVNRSSKFVLRVLLSLVFLIALSDVSFSASENSDAPFQGYFSLAWENDMFFHRDYYYSNGFQAEFFHQKLRRSPFSWMLIPFKIGQNSNAYYGLQLRQEIYTPKDLGNDTISTGDHPYSCNLILSQIKIVNIPDRGLRLSSEFKLGILGPAAMGNRTQELAHSVSNPSRPPQGWDYQVGNDFILNYNLRAEKSLIKNGLTMFGLEGAGRLGTLHTDMHAGLWFRLDGKNSYFQRLGPPGDKRFNFTMHASAGIRYVIYDATLQGGMFNKTSPYIIPGEDLSRLLGNVGLTLSFELKQHQLVSYTNFITKRFTGSSPHVWMGINYRFWF